MKKKNLIILIIIIISSAISLYLVNHNYNFYQDEIIKITSVKKIKTSTSSNSLGLTETHYKEKITGIIMNGNNKGQRITINNEATASNVMTESYNKNDEVIIKDNTISNLKRDKYVVLMIIIFIIAIFLVGTYKGLASIISVIANITIFTLGLNCYMSGLNLIFLVLIESIFFTTFSLIISNGYSKKTKAAIITVFISTIFLTLLIFIVTHGSNYNGINLNGMTFLTGSPEEIFTAEIIIGGLGAIMDVAITISASFDELLNKNPKIKKEALIASGKEIGKDIMGIMINVLFFTYLCGGLPTFVLALRNGFTLTNYITSNYSLELTRFLTGSIGIVSTIPIAIFICLKIYKKEVK